MHRGKRPSGTAGCRQLARARTPRGSSAAARVRWLILECGCRHTAGVQRDAGRHQRARQARVLMRKVMHGEPPGGGGRLEHNPFSLQLHACSANQAHLVVVDRHAVGHEVANGHDGCVPLIGQLQTEGMQSIDMERAAAAAVSMEARCPAPKTAAGRAMRQQQRGHAQDEACSRAAATA